MSHNFNIGATFTGQYTQISIALRYSVTIYYNTTQKRNTIVAVTLNFPKYEKAYPACVSAIAGI